MSYDIQLYEPAFLKRALADDLGDWTDADPISDEKKQIVRDILKHKGYKLESSDSECEQYLHPNNGWGLTAQIFDTEI